MADGSLLFKICTHCGGDGLNPRTYYDVSGNPTLGTADCGVCNGDKYILWGYMTKDDFTIPDDLPIPE